MRWFPVLSLLGVATAGVTVREKGQCLVDSGEAVSDAMDAALFIWASYKRCGKVGLDTKCAIDVASAVKATNSMVNVVLKVLEKCDAIHTANKECGFAASQFTEHSAGLSAAAAQVYQKCPATAAPKPKAGLGAIASPVMCTIDIKNAAKGLFKTVKTAQMNNAACQTSFSEKNQYTTLNCDKNIMDITGAVAGMGSFVAGAIGQCKRTQQFGGNAKTDTRYSMCVQAASSLAEYLMEVSKDGINVAQKCGLLDGPPDTVIVEQQVGRLYEEGPHEVESSGSPMNFILGAFLPITALVSFVGGRYFASRREELAQTRHIVVEQH